MENEACKYKNCRIWTDSWTWWQAHVPLLVFLFCYVLFFYIFLVEILRKRAEQGGHLVFMPLYTSGLALCFPALGVYARHRGVLP